MTAPRLMTRAEAKAYCRVDPHLVCAPLAFGARLLWDRVALDAALDAMSARRGPADAASASNEDLDSELESARKRIAAGAISRRK
jgi:hypothetical protein